MVKLSKKFFTPIVQRNYWGEKQEMPESDTIGLYYDLFFVGVAYNLGHMVSDEKASSISILYFIGLFFPVSFLWFNKMIFDARFMHKGSFYRRVHVLADVLLIATATLHIDTLETLRNTKNVHMFAYCIAIMLTLPLNGLRYVEIYFRPKSSVEAKKTAVLEIVKLVLPFSIFLAATVSAGAGHFAYRSEKASRRLEETETDGVINDFPVILCICAYFSDLLFILVANIFFRITMSSEEKEEQLVPINYEYTIDRIEDWILLMIGESILSLVIVHVDGGGPMYYLTFYMGVSTMTIFLFANRRMSKTEELDHAIRSKTRRPLYLVMTQCFSLCVVAIGISFKMMLKEFIDGKIDSKSLAKNNDDIGTGLVELQRKRMATFYSIVFLLSLIFMEAMNFLHKSGIRKVQDLPLGAKIALGSLRVATLTLAGTSFLYIYDPPALIAIGCLTIFATFLHTYIVGALLKKGAASSLLDNEDEI